MAGSAGAAGTDRGEHGWADVFAALDTLAERYGKPGAAGDQSLDHALDAARALFDRVLADLGSLPDVMELSLLSSFEQQLVARRLVVAANLSGSTGDARTDRRRARDVVTFGPGSVRTHNRDAKRAAAVAANPQLGDAVGQGAVAPDSLDQLIKAADTTTGKVPGELIDAVDGMTADQTAQVVDRYLEDHVNVDEVEERYRRQMNARNVRRYRARGLAGIAIEGPDPLIDSMWEHLSADADRRYRAEGGRDTPAREQTPLDHRRFDAAHTALTGSRSQDTDSAGGRAAVVITVDGDQLFDDTAAADTPVATQLGSGPLPAELLTNYLRTSPIWFLIKDATGSPLWLGRTRRGATDQQFLALAVRDRGCVTCRASINRCNAHHLVPWTAPMRGQTNIDQMVLLCERCHRDLHHRNHTLYRQYRQQSPDGKPIWATRPATPDETPAAKPRYRQRE